MNPGINTDYRKSNRLNAVTAVAVFEARANIELMDCLGVIVYVNPAKKCVRIRTAANFHFHADIIT